MAQDGYDVLSKPYDIDILYVEDDEVSGKALLKFLQKEAKNVLVASNGLEGLKLFENHRPELVITDIRMPVMDGLKMSRAIKELDAKTSIIVTTSYNDVEFLMTAIDIGIDKYIIKPVKVSNLSTAIHECVIATLQQRAIHELNRLLKAKIGELSEKTIYLDNILRSSTDMAIIAMDSELFVRYFNPAAERLFGLDTFQAVGNHVKAIVDALPEGGPLFEDALLCARSGKSCVFTIKKPSPASFAFIENRLSSMKDEEDALAGYVLISHDITESVESRETIKTSLKDNELLLRELHHRVKNNLQIISSLLKLQFKYISDPYLLSLFADCECRLRAMSLVHEKLYVSRDLSMIDFRDYVSSLASGVVSSFKSYAGHVTTSIDVEDGPVCIDTAIPCGLIISELLSNSMKYAFHNGRDGEITISLHSDGDYKELTVMDNGIGLPSAVQLDTCSTLGLQLVAGLAEEQLHGVITIDRSEGTAFRLRFKELKYKNRIK
ncbi:MAG: response regulator [Nitrospirae bacterium]|nr:response regulator [Nitrospirota bacterium]